MNIRMRQITIILGSIILAPPVLAVVHLPPDCPPTTSPAPTDTMVPSPSPSEAPTATQGPSSTFQPSDSPSNAPSYSPTLEPTDVPSEGPTDSPAPSPSPSEAPTEAPSNPPSISFSPTISSPPSEQPSWSPSLAPTSSPSQKPSSKPSASPTNSVLPSSAPSLPPSISNSPTISQSPSVSIEPSWSPSASSSEQVYEGLTTMFPNTSEKLDEKGIEKFQDSSINFLEQNFAPSSAARSVIFKSVKVTKQSLIAPGNNQRRLDSSNGYSLRITFRVEAIVHAGYPKNVDLKESLQSFIETESYVGALSDVIHGEVADNNNEQIIGKQSKLSSKDNGNGGVSPLLIGAVAGVLMSITGSSVLFYLVRGWRQRKSFENDYGDAYEAKKSNKGSETDDVSYDDVKKIRTRSESDDGASSNGEEPPGTRSAISTPVAFVEDMTNKLWTNPFDRCHRQQQTNLDLYEGVETSLNYNYAPNLRRVESNIEVPPTPQTPGVQYDLECFTMNTEKYTKDDSRASMDFDLKNIFKGWTEDSKAPLPRKNFLRNRKLADTPKYVRRNPEDPPPEFRSFSVQIPDDIPSKDEPTDMTEDKIMNTIDVTASPRGSISASIASPTRGYVFTNPQALVSPLTQDAEIGVFHKNGRHAGITPPRAHGSRSDRPRRIGARPIDLTGM